MSGRFLARSSASAQVPVGSLEKAAPYTNFFYVYVFIFANIVAFFLAWTPRKDRIQTYIMCVCLYNIIKSALCCCSGTCLTVLNFVINFGSRNEISLDIFSSEWCVFPAEGAEELNAEGIVVLRRSLFILISLSPRAGEWLALFACN